jgi:hypothetical protein
MSEINSEEMSSGDGALGRGVFRTLGAVLGLGMIGFGGYWGIRIFLTILKVIETPQKAEPALKAWKTFLHLDHFQITIDKAVVSADLHFIPIIALGIGSFILALLAMKFMTAGAAIFSSMVLDIEAVKRIVAGALNTVLMTRRFNKNTSSS